MLNKFSTGSNLEERMAQRQRDTIESDRTSNGITFILKGIGCFFLAAFVFWAISAVEFGRGPRRLRLRVRGIIGVFILLIFLMAQYWLPPLIIRTGYA